MAFWSTDNLDDKTLKDPKRKFRFMVSFGNLDSDPGAMMWWASKVDKPGFTINAAEHKYLNHSFYFPGNITWSEVTLTLVDPVNPDITATISDILEVAGYDVPAPPTSEKAPGTMSKAKATNALGAVTIEQLDAEGAALETWKLWNCFVTDVQYGDLQYGEDSLSEVTLKLRYDWASVKATGKSALKDGKAAGTTYFNV